MQRKSIHVFIRLIALSSVTVLILSSCSIFSAFDRDRNEETQEAYSKFIGSIRPRSGDVESRYSLACYFQKRGKHILAVEEFRTVLGIDPTYVKAYNGMGVSYDSIGDHARAVASYKAALFIDPDLDYVINNLGYTYLLKGDLDSAIDCFEKAVSLNEKNARFRNNLGLAYAKKGKLDKAFNEFRLAGGEAKAKHNIAMVSYRNGHYNEAADQFSQAYGMNPSAKDAPRYLRASKSMAGIFNGTDKNEIKQAESADDTHKAVVAKSEKKISDSTTSVARNEKLDTIDRKKEINTDSFNSELIYVKGTKTSAESNLLMTADPNSSVESNSLVESNRLAGKAQSANYKQIQVASITPPLHRPETKNQAVQSFESKIGVMVSNGNGVRHMARRVGKYLNGKGYEITRLTNAKHFNFNDTIIYYCDGYLQEAYQVAKYIPGMNEMRKVPYLWPSSTKVRVLIGRDLIVYNNVFEEKRKEHNISSPVKLASR